MNGYATWAELYTSDLQSVFALQVMPVAFLVYRLVRSPDYASSVAPAAAPFVDAFTGIFAVQTLLDPLATGPLLKATGLADAAGGTAVAFLFVYLGDFRVLALVCALALGIGKGSRWLRTAVLAALVVPVAAGALYAGLRWLDPGVRGQWLWMIYEVGFLSLAVGASRIWLARRGVDAATLGFLRDVLGFAAAYYALWALSDLLIVVGGLDAGWALRVIPNQLYYGAFVPFVYLRFFGFAAPRPAP